MTNLSSNDIRIEFLKYFEQKGHRPCSSYPLVPPNDPTLLFTNAGMVQFKDIFTGKERREFGRAVSSQKCLRAGGKHNDLENVGYTARHHTFFEMLGNFSFGDYFKREAIGFAWEFLVDRMQLPVDRLWVTVFAGDREEGLPADDEAADLWRKEAAVSPERILRFGKKDNFWSMGDTGPCGPCSEIHFDQGDAVPCHAPAGCRGVGCECDRFLELWNLVFMQFERSADGRLTPLPAPSIDTGMGLERLSAVLQHVHSNYDTDLFTPLTSRMAEIAAKRLGADPTTDVSLRVAADHARATAFLMADGVLPSNEGRGYVLRRIMRRAIRHGAKLGVDQPFLHEVCNEVVRLMGATYPELVDQRQLIEKATRLEEETFRRTLDSGLKLLLKEISLRQGSSEKVLPGRLVFDLQTRDGFPPDLTAVIAREHGFGVDERAYQDAWEHHQTISGQGLGMEGVDDLFKLILAEVGSTQFKGYGATSGEGTIQAIISVREQPDEKGRPRVIGRERVDRATAGQVVEAVVSPTPFYGQTGGQVGDTGCLSFPAGTAVVCNADRPLADLIVHRLQIQRGELKTGDVVRLEVDPERRTAIRLNHSATHLLHAALRKVLGKHVNQKGSLVAPDRLRFDFSHFAPMTAAEITEVEREVNQQIRANHAVEVTETDVGSARAAGATMLFGEKYGERVRLVRMGEDSLELCGGTHTGRTGDIGLFRIASDGGVQAGVRRIEAVTGAAALDLTQETSRLLEQVAEVLRTAPAQVLERLRALNDSERKLQREVESLRQRLATSGGASDPAGAVREVAGVRMLATRTSGIALSGLRAFADQIRDKLGRGVVLAAVEDAGKISFVCSVSKELTDRLKAGVLLQAALKITGGKGGGRPDFAQGGGGDPALLDQAFERFYSEVEQSLGTRP